jgi:hemolysin III
MIAGTITPYALFVIMPQNKTVGLVMLIVAWVVVAAAIPLTIVIFNQTKVVQMVLYLALGWMVIFCIKTLWNGFDRTGFLLLVAGGILYTVGAIIYGIGAKKKYFHSVFHFFVLLGSILHFLSLFFFVFVKK